MLRTARIENSLNKDFLYQIKRVTCSYFWILNIQDDKMTLQSLCCYPFFIFLFFGQIYDLRDWTEEIMPKNILTLKNVLLLV